MRDDLADHAQECYGGSAGKVNESGGVGSISRGLLAKHQLHQQPPRARRTPIVGVNGCWC
jgi:hypothetical protein